jgi:hypothetical protein
MTLFFPSWSVTLALCLLYWSFLGCDASRISSIESAHDGCVAGLDLDVDNDDHDCDGLVLCGHATLVGLL